MGSTEETIFQAPFIWTSAWNKKRVKLYSGIVADAVIPKTVGQTLRNYELIKYSYMAKNEL
jgi:hypothetical protein